MSTPRDESGRAEMEREPWWASLWLFVWGVQHRLSSLPWIGEHWRSRRRFLRCDHEWTASLILPGFRECVRCGWSTNNPTEAL
jgi:hypothetical protein